MRIAAAVVVVLLLLSGVLVERRACQCGGGILSTSLPDGFRADWFNGTFWLTDTDGWGVIAPPAELEVTGGTNLSVRRVRRYTVDRGLVAEVELASGDVTLVAVEGPADSISMSRLAPEDLRRRADSDTRSIRWLDVRPESCLFGLFWAVRAAFVVGIVGALGVALRSRTK